VPPEKRLNRLSGDRIVVGNKYFGWHFGIPLAASYLDGRGTLPVRTVISFL
jgi:hypothetical protein